MKDPLRPYAAWVVGSTARCSAHPTHDVVGLVSPCLAIKGLAGVVGLLRSIYQHLGRRFDWTHFDG